MANLTTKARSIDPKVGQWVDQSPVQHIAGETYTHSLTWLGATTVSVSSVLVSSYDGSDKTSTFMPSGSHSASGNVATFKPLVIPSTGYAGSTVVVAIVCTVDGNTEIRKLEVQIKSKVYR